MNKRPTLYFKLVISTLMISLCCFSFGQQNEDIELRGRNVITPGAGSAFINGDYVNPRYETYGQIGYKRFINSHLNLNLNYKKFDLDYDNLFQTGFMAFDINVEYYVFPQRSFSPYAFIGSGLIVTNNFEEPNNKLHAGFGIEMLLNQNFGLSISANGNYHFLDTINSEVYPDVDELYFGAGVGINIYFDSILKPVNRTKQKQKDHKDEPTVIGSNPIIHEKSK